MTLLRAGSATDTGLVRSVNQDLAVETGTLFAVADGMGGHAGGEVAARLAVDTLTHAFSSKPTGAGLSDAVSEANRVVFEHSIESPDLRGLGTTMTAAALVNEDGRDVIALVNVGDSRSYRFHDGELDQITVDHSLAEEMVRSGEISESEAAVHPHRHILTRALGVGEDVAVDLWRVQPSRGDRYLLCSDGLTNELDESQIAGVLATESDPQVAADLLVRAARTHGGSDNITVVVIDAAIVYGALYAVRWYDTNAYYVQVSNNELMIYHGRVGGGVLYNPVRVERTGVTTADVPAYALPQLVKGVQEDSLKAAQYYVIGLVASQHQATCAQNPTAAGCTTPPTTSAPGAPTTTTSTKAP